jgi:methionyl-tRNA formyltransferase
MGTPDFAVPSLAALHDSHFRVDLVVTQPDRPRGRGRKPAMSPVKTTALSMNYPIHQPVSIREPEFVGRLREMAPDFFIVVAFGQILSRELLSIPKRGAVNVHASLLPKYRGPAPIQWALIRGEQQTGATTMLMDHGVDTGDLLLSAATRIEKSDTAESLHDRLSVMGADLLVETLHKLWQGTLYPTSQKHEYASYAPMLRKQDGRINWNKSAVQLFNFVRAMAPWPGSFCYWDDQRLRIHRAGVINQPADSPPGTVVKGFPDELRVATADGILLVKEIQAASGKRMPVKEFLRGHPMPPGIRLA